MQRYRQEQTMATTLQGNYTTIDKRTGANRIRLLLLVSLFMTAVTIQANEDPLIELNRSVHGFNSALDRAVLKPVATTYDQVTPSFVKRRLNSFFTNVDDVKVVVNDLLQLKFKQAAADTGRLLLNTTVGLGGLFDVAEPLFGLEKHQEDFGQTLGYWKVGAGPYVELPFMGPSTARDTAGLLVDVLFNPLQLLHSPSQQTALVAGEGVTDRAALLDVEGLISGDEYLFFREAYLQRREFLVRDGAVEDSFDDFDDGFDGGFDDGFDELEADGVFTVASE